MLRIGILNSKGGVGKSLIAQNLAVRGLKDFGRVALVDADPQQGSVGWSALRGERDDGLVVSKADGEVSAALEALEADGVELALVDGPPGFLNLTEEAIAAVDFVCVPMKASVADIKAGEYCVSACIDFGTPYLIVVNEAATERRVTEAVETLRDLGQPVAQTIVKRRVGLTDASNAGKAASEIGRAGVQSAEEIDRLYLEVITAARASAQGGRNG